jgi:predicted ATPase
VVGHALTLTNVLFLAAHVRQFRGELEAAWGLGQRLVSLAHQQGFALYEAGGELLQGWLLVHQGELAPGVERMTMALAYRRTTGSQLFLPFFMAFLAEAALRRGHMAEGLDTVEAALRLTASNFDRFWEPELYRLRGELLLAQPGARHAARQRRAAAASFQQALDVARVQEAKALELRAALSLGRLWQSQGKPEAAHGLLTEVYAWFTEGFDTADLRTARTMLGVLEGFDD